MEFEKLGAFYLGKEYDLKTGRLLDRLLMYDARDLTTHAVCVGMTGSGKTGLCIDLLEEAAIDRVPAIIVDPKGDITNILLTFPNLKPEDFRPWINIDDARRKGLSEDEFAAQQAELWRNGLAQWGQNGERIKLLKDSADFVIYTPGSDAGVPVSILQSFAAPDLSWESESELLRERIQGTVRALLGLIGVDADPVRSREHILLANLFEYFWRNREDLDLLRLIQSIQHPPIRQLGAFDVDTFYPKKERSELALRLNNIIAAPSFQNWLVGQPLDIPGFMSTPEGKTRHSIFYLAHLSDPERMFFLTIFLNQIIMWMRAQPGTTSLRAIFYMDEIFGFFPPVANPPSKQPMLTLLKQARAFGLGIVLTTQNPADLDYKGLANAGTWFIGRLQTERDKMRLLDGLEGVSSTAGQPLNRDELSRIISSLTNRVFLLHNVHEEAPVTFQTRWAMSYLRGPLTRLQVKDLMRDRKPDQQTVSSLTVAGYSRTRPTPATYGFNTRMEFAKSPHLSHLRSSPSTYQLE
ncbi:ATP-binding protein [Candidatus Bathyarchaeota archaeon]|nr:ATP-binding protein [Candidatus Bathyarchaeota archaeon]MBS7628958.1 ATP-binding protein [Candidatus Bathyarchaeota archaeon]